MTALRSALLMGAAVLIATGFAAGSILARLSYDSGVTPLTVSSLRSAAALAVPLAVLRLQGVSPALPRRLRMQAAALGLLMASFSYGLFVAIGLMPVALAIGVFYTWPFMVGLGAWALGQERLTWLWPVAAATAFAGLVVALDVGGAVPHPLGVALALLGAVGWSVMLLVNRRIVGSADSRPVTLWMLLATVGAFAVACVVTGDVRLPDDAVGWAALGGAAAIYSVLPMSVFAVTRAAGPVRTALAMNFEPIASLVLGAAVLDQRLALPQVMGMALVVAALVVARGASAPVAAPAR